MQRIEILKSKIDKDKHPYGETDNVPQVRVNIRRHKLIEVGSLIEHLLQPYISRIAHLFLFEL